MVVITKIYDNNSTDKILVYFLYVNSSNEIYNIKNKTEFINNGEISRERQLYLIKENQFNELKKHKLISLSYINFDINEDDIEDLINNKLEKVFFKKLETIEDIKFNPSLFLFTRINCIFYIYKELTHSEHTTRKIMLNIKHRKSRKA
tara:strand:- start:408 stop:851 length:444 start_codon:yes stop_codon:yes gene_type:complete